MSCLGRFEDCDVAGRLKVAEYGVCTSAGLRGEGIASSVSLREGERRSLGIVGAALRSLNYWFPAQSEHLWIFPAGAGRRFLPSGDASVSTDCPLAAHRDLECERVAHFNDVLAEERVEFHFCLGSPPLEHSARVESARPVSF